MSSRLQPAPWTRTIGTPAVGAELDHMLTQAADVDQTPARRMRPLDQPRADKSDDCAGGKDFGGGGQRVHQVWMDSPLSQRAPCS